MNMIALLKMERKRRTNNQITNSKMNERKRKKERKKETKNRNRTIVSKWSINVEYMYIDILGLDREYTIIYIDIG